METFSTLLAICAGNSPVSGELSTQRLVTWSFDVFFDLRLNNLKNIHLQNNSGLTQFIVCDHYTPYHLQTLLLEVRFLTTYWNLPHNVLPITNKHWFECMICFGTWYSKFTHQFICSYKVYHTATSVGQMPWWTWLMKQHSQHFQSSFSICPPADHHPSHLQPIGSFLHCLATLYDNLWLLTLMARFMGPTWGPSGADRTQVGPMLAPWTLPYGQLSGERH